ncbi:MAG: alpha/beta fold hydrolase [Nevskia sp.]
MKPWRARLAGAALPCLLLAACAQPAPETDAVVDDRIERSFPNPPRPEPHDYLVEGRRVHYLLMPGGPARIVFIHGTPGDWRGWAGFLADPQLRERATMIAVDRPGFGNSGRGRMLPEIADQSRLLAPLLTIAGGGEGGALLVGHSLGGPIAARLAMDYPQQVRAALLIAPSIAPEYENPRWFNRLADSWLAHALAGSWLMHRVADDDLYNSNAEIMPLVHGLRQMEPGWAALKMPITVMQGLQDDLVDPRTADYAERVLPKPNGVVQRLPDEDHFVLWREPQLVTAAILALLDRSPR